jgi:hypothetical protein
MIVAKTIKAVQEANKNPQKALVTWKRKYEEDLEVHDLKKKKKKKKKGLGGESKPTEKGHKNSGNLSIENGSGMAEVAEQPHRPL